LRRFGVIFGNSVQRSAMRCSVQQSVALFSTQQHFCVNCCCSAAERSKTVVFNIAFTALRVMAISPCFLTGAARPQRLDLEVPHHVYGHLMRLSSHTGRSVQELAADLIAQHVRSQA
jgi:hypothetical protein